MTSYGGTADQDKKMQQGSKPMKDTADANDLDGDDTEWPDLSLEVSTEYAQKLKGGFKSEQNNAVDSPSVESQYS